VVLWIIRRVVDARQLGKPHRQECLCYFFRKKSGKLIEMKITVEIPSALRRFTDGVQTIECSSETLPDLLGEIEQRFPAISKHLRDDAGQVRRFVNIYVNEEDIRFLGGNAYKFREGDRVLVVPSIAGGAPADACG
jgi:molybdopterin converting factor small subunit